MHCGSKVRFFFVRIWLISYFLRAVVNIPQQTLVILPWLLFRKMRFSSQLEWRRLWFALCRNNLHKNENITHSKHVVTPHRKLIVCCFLIVTVVLFSQHVDFISLRENVSTLRTFLTLETKLVISSIDLIISSPLHFWT